MANYYANGSRIKPSDLVRPYPIHGLRVAKCDSGWCVRERHKIRQDKPATIWWFLPPTDPEDPDLEPGYEFIREVREGIRRFW